eukprot:CAMPEP_0194415584 /NCGR_PEP_ID=MMETSP0176-20130528/14382_1 /TAXON_ID=216777 /ORGANISM="Proboscia alata, Strain PI-D3" /LENGTH=60 /DNA_ID=CAMNT_0039220321 /DNA_START=1 /DNA_END=181 /DNA_ORIENTATION=+
MGAAEISPSDVVSFVLDEWQCNTTARLRKWSDAAETWGFGGFDPTDEHGLPAARLLKASP